MSDTLKRNVYRIDQDDNIVSVEEAWDDFAASNDAPELEGKNVIERNLWDFVSDELTRHIYKQMTAEVRKGRSLTFGFRCDSPDQVRFLEMRMTPFSEEGVQFETFTSYIEERPPQEIFRRSSKVIDEVVIACSWCKKIKTAENVWHEVEQAIQILQLFDVDPAPQLSHGMCEDCYGKMIVKLKG